MSQSATLQLGHSRNPNAIPLIVKQFLQKNSAWITKHWIVTLKKNRHLLVHKGIPFKKKMIAQDSKMDKLWVFLKSSQKSFERSSNCSQTSQTFSYACYRFRPYTLIILSNEQFSAFHLCCVIQDFNEECKQLGRKVTAFYSKSCVTWHPLLCIAFVSRETDIQIEIEHVRNTLKWLQ